MSTTELARCLTALGSVLAKRMPIVLAATITLLESVLETANVDVRAARMPTAGVMLTATQVLETARAHGVLAFSEGSGDRLLFLASIPGIDLTDPAIRAALLEMHHRGELRLARIGNPGAARADLGARKLRIALVNESVFSDWSTTFHAVVIS